MGRTTTVVAALLLALVPFMVMQFSHIRRSVMMSTPEDFIDNAIQSFVSPALPVETKKKKNAWICITGVLGDLELANKMQHLFQPLQQAGYEVHLGFMLQDDEQDIVFMSNREPYSFQHKLYNNNYVPSISRDNLTGVMQELYELPFGPNPDLSVKKLPYLRNLTQYRPRNFRNASEIMSFLNHTTTTSVEIYKPAILPMNLEYLRSFMHHNGVRKGFLRLDTFGRSVWMANNHVRGLDNLHKCWSQWLQEQDSYNPQDIAMRVGEDAIITDHMSVNKMVTQFFDPSAQSPVVTLPCQTARGHAHDQVDAVPMSMAKKFFTQPWNRFHLYDSSHTETLADMSTYLSHVYQTLHDPVNSKALSPIPFPLSPQFLVDELNHTVGVNLTQTLGEKTNKTALVCITGQIERLEMENKLKTLIQPLEEVGYKVDIAFALASGKAHIQAKKMASYSTVNETFFQQDSDLHDFIQKHNLSVISPHLTYVPHPNLPTNSQFVLHASRMSGFQPRMFDYAKLNPQRLDDVLNQRRANTKIFDSYKHCWDHAQQVNQSYDMYVRIRDDMGFGKPLEKSFFDDLTPDAVKTVHDRNNGGINDRFAVVGGHVAHCFFYLPSTRFYDGEYHTINAQNSETYLKDVYFRRNICRMKILLERYVKPIKMYGATFLEEIE